MLQKRNIYSIVIALIIFFLGLFIVNTIWFRPFFISHFFYKEMIQSLKQDPQTASKAKAPFFYKRSRNRLNDISLDGIECRAKHLNKYSQWLSEYPEKGLFKSKSLDREMIQWHLNLERQGYGFKFYDYPINPYNGFQVQLPSYLMQHHHIQNKKDIKAFHERLQLFPEYFNQLQERFGKSRQTGTLLPVKILDQSVAQMKVFIQEDPEHNPLYLSFKAKLDALPSIRNKEKHLTATKKIIEQIVYPAYEDLIKYTNSFRLLAPKKIGVHHFPNGKDYYEYLLKKHTSLDLSPDSLYKTGISETWRIKDELVEELKKLNKDVDRRNVIENLKKIGKKEEYYIGNSIKGRMKCKNLLDSLVKSASVNTADWFDELPESQIEIKRIPYFKEAFAPIAYYEIATMDGNGKASINMRMDILDDFPAFSLPTLVYHETYPGHHFQLANYLESNDIPMYRKRFQNNGYIEGWAMYAEQLAHEQGMYADDPLGNIGRLHAMLFRAARMVSDIGIHYMDWSRENAIIFMTKNTILSRELIESEVDRYTVDPAQGVSYTAGYLKFIELRQEAESKLGSEFDLREFNKMLLSNGIVPFFILEEMVDDFIIRKTKK